MQTLHLILILLLHVSAVSVFITKNPVHSVLSLIFTFCNAAAILLMLNAEFLGLIFIIIYVGAIAVLFLFVVMMLNVKVYYSQSSVYLPVLFFCIFTFSTELSILLEKVFLISFVIPLENVYTPSLFVDNLTSIDVLGQSLYNYYLLGFLLAGLVLLVAMIGAITLTLNFQNQRKNELVLKELFRSSSMIKLKF
jgi:NADH-quinone oxidoreductase subunit J